MNSSQIVTTMAAEADTSKAIAERILEAFAVRVKAHNDEGRNVALRSFGTFSQGLLSPKAGINPKTGTPISYTTYHRPANAPSIAYDVLLGEIADDTKADPATAVPRFKASKARNVGAKFAAGTGFKAAVPGRPA